MQAEYVDVKIFLLSPNLAEVYLFHKFEWLGGEFFKYEVFLTELYILVKVPATYVEEQPNYDAH